jgi:hypothetical protein
MTRSDLERLVDEAPDEALPQLAGDLEMAKAKVYARLTTPKPATVDVEPDRNLSAQEAATRLGVSDSWLYKHPDLPFVVRIGGRTLYNLRGLEKWNRSRQRRS